MVADIIFSTAAAVLSGLGVGSGGLLVIYLTLGEEYPQIVAQGLNLLFFIFSSGAAMAYHLTHRKINYGAVLTLILTGIPGALVGTSLLNVFGGGVTRKIFGAMLVISGIIALKRSKIYNNIQKKP